MPQIERSLRKLQGRGQRNMTGNVAVHALGALAIKLRRERSVMLHTAQLAGNDLGLRIENQALGQPARIFAPDYALGPMEGGTYRYQAFGAREPTRPAIAMLKKRRQNLPPV